MLFYCLNQTPLDWNNQICSIRSCFESSVVQYILSWLRELRILVCLVWEQLKGLSHIKLETVQEFSLNLKFSRPLCHFHETNNRYRKSVGLFWRLSHRTEGSHPPLFLVTPASRLEAVVQVLRRCCRTSAAWGFYVVCMTKCFSLLCSNLE